MAKLQITQKGFEGYTGFMGHIEFEGGVSTEDVSKAEAERLGCLFKVVFVDGTGQVTGVDPAFGNGLTAPVRKSLSDRAADIKNALMGKKEAPAEEEEEVSISPSIAQMDFDYDIDSLEAMVDEGGIKQLRDFSTHYGVTGKSVSEIVERMLKLKDARSNTEA